MNKIKYAILIITLAVGTAAHAIGADVPVMNLINGPMGAGGNQVHDMQMINDMKFRHHEYNDYKEIKEQKEAKEKELKLTEPAMKRIYNQKPKQKVQFTEQNGQIKIKSIE